MLQVTSHIAEAVEGKEMLLFVTPSQRMRENVRLLAPFVGKDTLLINASKGIEINSLKRMTEVISEEISGAHNRIGALSGPNIAQEVAEGKPTAGVVAAYEEVVATRARVMLNTAWFRVYTASDLVGVELGGALKNIIAIGAGFVAGEAAQDEQVVAVLGHGLEAGGHFVISTGSFWHPVGHIRPIGDVEECHTTRGEGGSRTRAGSGCAGNGSGGGLGDHRVEQGQRHGRPDTAKDCTTRNPWVAHCDSPVAVLI